MSLEIVSCRTQKLRTFDLYACGVERKVLSAVCVMISLFEAHDDPICAVTTNCL